MKSEATQCCLRALQGLFLCAVCVTAGCQATKDGDSSVPSGVGVNGKIECVLANETACGITTSGTNAVMVCLPLDESGGNLQWVVSQDCGSIRCCTDSECVSIADGIAAGAQFCDWQGPGDVCTVSADCLEDYYCGPEKTCRSRLEEGELCKSDRDCAVGLACVDSFCAEATCENTGDCMAEEDSESVSGPIVWNRSLSSASGCNDVFEDSSGNLVVVYTDGVRLLDAEGETIWDSEVYDTGTARQAWQDSYGDYLAAWQGGSNDTAVAKLVKNGNIAWSEDYYHVNCVAEADGGYLLGRDSHLTMLTKSGVESWDADLEEYGKDKDIHFLLPGLPLGRTLGVGVFRDEDEYSGYMVGAAAFDQSGDVKWEVEFVSTSQESLEDVTETLDGSYVLLFNHHVSGEPDYPTVLKITNNATTVWKRAHALGSASDTLAEIVPLNSGGYLAVGVTRSFGAGKDDAWLVHLGDDGKFVADAYVGEAYSNERFRAVTRLANGDVLILGTRDGASCWALRYDFEKSTMYGGN